MYKGPDNSGIVIKLVKEQRIPSALGNQASKSHESTTVYCGFQGKELTKSSPRIVIYVVLSCLVVHNISR